MSSDRLPFKMLTAWVRPTKYHSNRGLSSVNHGTYVLKYLEKLGIPEYLWYTKAQDRPTWRDIVMNIAF